MNGDKNSSSFRFKSQFIAEFVQFRDFFVSCYLVFLSSGPKRLMTCAFTIHKGEILLFTGTADHLTLLRLLLHTDTLLCNLFRCALEFTMATGLWVPWPSHQQDASPNPASLNELYGTSGCRSVYFSRSNFKVTNKAGYTGQDGVPALLILRPIPSSLRPIPSSLRPSPSYIRPIPSSIDLTIVEYDNG